MRTIPVLIAVVLAVVPLERARAQGVAAGDVTALRRSLAIDPFALAPYRLLAVNLKPAERIKLAEELARAGPFPDSVLAARLYLDAGRVELARACLRDASAKLPSDPRPLDAFCQLAMSTGAYAEMGLAARRALERGRSPQRLVVAAIAELRQGRQKEGLALLAEVRSKDPSGAAADGMLDALLGQRLFAEGAELLRAELGNSVASTTPNAAVAAKWRRLADLERQLNRPERASDALLHALDVESASISRRAVAQMVMRIHRERHTLPELSRALKDATSAPRLVLRGDVENELGHASAALSSYEAAAKRDPADPDPPMRLAAMAKSPADRAERYAALVASHPGELHYALELADLRFASKDEAAGKKVLREAAQRFATAPSAQDQIAKRLAEHRDLEGALQCRRRAAELDPRSAEYALALGDAYRALNQRALALAAYDDSLRRADYSRGAWDRVIDALERAGYVEEADARYTEARGKWPADMVLARRQANTLEARRQPARALAVWREILKASVKPAEQESAKYNVERLDSQVRLEGDK